MSAVVETCCKPSNVFFLARPAFSHILCLNSWKTSSCTFAPSLHFSLVFCLLANLLTRQLTENACHRRQHTVPSNQFIQLYLAYRLCHGKKRSGASQRARD